MQTVRHPRPPTLTTRSLPAAPCMSLPCPGTPGSALQHHSGQRQELDQSCQASVQAVQQATLCSGRPSSPRSAPACRAAPACCAPAPEVHLAAEVHEGVEGGVDFQVHAAAVAAVAAAGPAPGHKLLASEGHAAAPAVAALNVDAGGVEAAHLGWQPLAGARRAAAAALLLVAGVLVYRRLLCFQGRQRRRLLLGGDPHGGGAVLVLAARKRLGSQRQLGEVFWRSSGL